MLEVRLVLPSQIRQGPPLRACAVPRERSKHML